MSLRKAVTAKCKECIYDENDKGTWRMQVEACTATKCPLFDYRPITKATRAKINSSVDFSQKLANFGRSVANASL